MDKHLSLDIETLDVDPSPNAAVVAVGAVVFTQDQILEQKLWTIDPMLTPGSRSESTWRWWMEQSSDVMRSMFSGTTPPWEFCTDFSAFVGMNGIDWVWGYPARFDLGHLRQLFRAMDRPFPLIFRQERDLSTLRWLVKNARFLGSEGFWDRRLEEIKMDRVAHDALSDALEQAKQVQAVLTALQVE